MLTAAHVNIGDYYFDRQLWAKASQYYDLANATEKQIECLYNLVGAYPLCTA